MIDKKNDKLPIYIMFLIVGLNLAGLLTIILIMFNRFDESAAKFIIGVFGICVGFSLVFFTMDVLAGWDTYKTKYVIVLFSLLLLFVLSRVGVI